MADPAVCAYLAKVLCARGGRLRLEALPLEVGLPPAQLQQVLDAAGPGRFLVRRRGGDAWVLAVSAVRLCVRQECGGCERLHLCKLNLRGRCRVRACKYSHEVLSEGNQKVLKSHELSGLNEDELRVLLLQNDPFLLPDVCPAYNKGEGSCALGENCARLHVCRYFLRGECRFPQCKRSHHLLEPRSMRLLLLEGLGHEVVWNIQMICDSRVASLAGELSLGRRLSSAFQPAPTRDPPQAAGPGGQRREPALEGARNSVTAGPPDQAVKAPPCPKREDTQKEKSDEICIYYVWRFCKNRNNCPMIHYDLPYRWQIFSENGWKDLPKREEIEKAYCDPSITRFPDLDLNFRTMTSNTIPIRRLSTPSSVTKAAKFVMTTKWLWFWENELCQWVEYGKQGVQPHQASLDSDDLENLFLADPKGSISFRAGSQQYLLNFKDMIQRNLNYTTERRVRRRPKFVSSEDVKTKKGHAAAPAGPVLTPGPAISYPADWDRSALPPIGYEAIEVSKPSAEYVKIESLFQKTMKNYEIRRIKRIQNPSLWQVYQWQKEQMRKKRRGQNVDERLLFHGTKASSTKAICTDNFDWRICGTNGTVLGKGSYFACEARYSHAYCADADEKVMFVASVLVGDFVKGHATYTRPPAKSAEAGSYYDSCVDNLLSPLIFVIFEKHQVYPAYIISYKEDVKCILS